MRLQSRWVDLDGPVHYVEAGPDDAARRPVLVAVHGLGGSYANWLALAPLLTDRYRFLALDLPGFGLTRGHGRRTDVHAAAALVRRFVDAVVGGPAVWLGNSMGGLVTLLAASDHAPQLAAAVLLDPALAPRPRHRPDPLATGMFGLYFVPGLGRAAVAGRRRLRSPEQLAMESLTLCTVDVARIPDEIVRAHVELARDRARMPGVSRDFVGAARSILPALLPYQRMLALAHRVEVPVLLLHGERDRLVPVGAARDLAAAMPGWRFAEAADVGHLPMLEVPKWTAEQIEAWLPSVR